MSATSLVATYSAVIATSALGWQIWIQVRRRRTRVMLLVGHSAPPVADTDLAGRLVYRVTITAVNTGETQETVVALGFEALDHEHGIDDRPIAESLPPGGIVRREWDLLALDFDPTPGVVPYVELASDPGKAFGEPEPLIGELIQEECWPVYAQCQLPKVALDPSD
jgi:hypothetical protein